MKRLGSGWDCEIGLGEVWNVKLLTLRLFRGAVCNFILTVGVIACVDGGVETGIESLLLLEFC